MQKNISHIQISQKQQFIIANLNGFYDSLTLM